MSDAAAVAGITRTNLAGRVLLVLRRGGRLRPDVLLVEAAGGRAVVKDFAPRARLVRATLGRLLVRREVAIHRALAGLPSVPRLHGRLDAYAFVVEHRAGVRISRRRPWIFTQDFVQALRAAVGELHTRGVVHLDLSHRGNVRAALDGSPVLIDFESALRFRAGGPVAALLLPLLRRVDERALAKWQRLVADADAAAVAGPAAERPQPSDSASRAGGASGNGRGASRPM